MYSSFLLCLCWYINLVLAEDILLYAKDLINQGNEGQLFAKIDYNELDKNATVIEVSDFDGKSTGPFCIYSKFQSSTKYDHLENKCFSFMNIVTPLHYLVDIEMHETSNSIHKISLLKNEDVDGIEVIVSYPEVAHEAPAGKLRKITKTYKDKKLEKNQPSQIVKETTEDEQQSWIQQNWKLLALGWVIYNVIMIGVKKTQEQGKEQLQNNAKTD
ncbi:hypothetical protein TPHA_0A03880 [Tetrapisispora phaffii CBS 4417]|uniref:ER membrane protein complex subunit 10 n=1 Tax=Tetrapisispora phaffii (strain ATCC 24235 / CBS 4417 / NBRC 1672 / NRRL Y-8282 / UCD 70-5) TaxID=1071381 RepID=G8BNI6_TETPH|nr:hypothetical protein TPHA_0A03880 [Tetrapisispora phaffii CBS 4417]CCE61464.1 hypothetical protein TPHA_0A03880 [Tetrapisispora phaffii CBS 4417]